MYFPTALGAPHDEYESVLHHLIFHIDAVPAQSTQIYPLITTAFRK